MRSISPEELARFSPKIVNKPNLALRKDELLAAAISEFPGQLAAAMAFMPAPVLAPRPEGSWIIDVKRDHSGQMTQLTGKFHATK